MIKNLFFSLKFSQNFFKNQSYLFSSVGPNDLKGGNVILHQGNIRVT